MLSAITTFEATNINGITKVGDLSVNINVTSTLVSGNAMFQESPGQYLSVSLDLKTGKSSVTFSADDSAAMLTVVEDITAKLLLIKEELEN